LITIKGDRCSPQDLAKINTTIKQTSIRRFIHFELSKQYEKGRKVGYQTGYKYGESEGRASERLKLESDKEREYLRGFQEGVKSVAHENAKPKPPIPPKPNRQQPEPQPQSQEADTNRQKTNVEKRKDNAAGAGNTHE
jgi:hypothetical protein